MKLVRPELIFSFHLDQIAIFTEAEKMELSKILKIGHAHPGQILFDSEEKLSSCFWFPLFGVLRAYRNVNGKDITYSFANSYKAFGNVSYCISGQSDDIKLEAITKTIFMYFDYKDLISLEKKIPKVEKIRSYIVKKANIFVTGLLADICTKDLKTRYWELIENAAELFQKIPQYHIASYLGVEPQSLSRLKAQLKKEMSTHS